MPSCCSTCASAKWPIRTFAMTGMVTASIMPRISSRLLIRATPPAARMSAGMRSSAMTATAPGFLRDDGLLRRDDVHDDAALEHLREPALDGDRSGMFHVSILSGISNKDIGDTVPCGRLGRRRPRIGRALRTAGRLLGRAGRYGGGWRDDRCGRRQRPLAPDRNVRVGRGGRRHVGRSSHLGGRQRRRKRLRRDPRIRETRIVGGRKRVGSLPVGAEGAAGGGGRRGEAATAVTDCRPCPVACPRTRSPIRSPMPIANSSTADPAARTIGRKTVGRFEHRLFIIRERSGARRRVWRHARAGRWVCR